jgi:putative ABC transport system permease protein
MPAAQLEAMPYLQGASLNGRVFAFTAVVSLLTGVVFGLVPAWQAVRLNVQQSLKAGSRLSSGSRHQRFRSALVVAEVALALVLLTGAGLLIKSAKQLADVKLGFTPERLLTLQLELPATRYAGDAQSRNFHQQLLSRITTLPGVTGAASVNWLPLAGGPVDLLQVEGQAPRPASEVPKTTTHVVSSDYFHTMGIALIKGRYFTEADDQSAPQVLIINQALAKKLFGSDEPLGRRLLFEGDEAKPYEIVGVVDDERVGELDEEPVSVVYRPYLQDPWTKLNLVVRTAGEPSSLIAAMRSEVQGLDRDLALYAVAPMEQLIAERPATFLRRYPALLLAVFAMLAVILAVVGIYGVMANAVSQRTQELGIRQALGAGRVDIFKLVLGQGLRLMLVGVASGLVGALALTRLLESLLFGVSATDPLIFAVVTLLLLAAAAVACIVPARRAARVDPALALRGE